MGNSQLVAKHYLQVTDEHFKMAAAKSTLDKIQEPVAAEQK